MVLWNVKDKFDHNFESIAILFDIISFLQIFIW